LLQHRFIFSLKKMIIIAPRKLLTLTLENNIFMGSLNPSLYEKKIAELEPYLKTNVPEHIKSDLKTIPTNVELADDEQNADLSLDAMCVHALQFLLHHEDPDIACGEKEVEYCTKLKAYKFAVSALDFISLFEGANDVFNSMLLSNNSSDVTETVRFFVRARHFDLPCAVTGMKNALSLMWSTESNIRDEVLKGFVDVFLAMPGTDGAELLPEDQIVQNLLFLVYNATVSELASIEEAVKLLVKDERIPAEVFLTLWNTVVRDHGGARASAMLIISMGASANPSIVDSSCRLRMLLEAGLGEQAEVARDWDTIRSAACALQQIGRVQSSSPEGSAKSIVIEMVVERLCIVARGDWCKDDVLEDTNHWFSAAEQAIDAIFVICDEPEKACSDILRGLEAITFGVSSNSPVSACNELRLSRFFFVVGHIALKLLVYTESLSNAVNKGNALKALKKQEGAEKSKAGKKKAIPNDAEDAIEKELGVDAEAEAERDRKISEISEKEIVGRGLIGLFGQILVRVIDNEDCLFSSDILRQSAVLALCKFMCISSEFCEKHLPLLFYTATNEVTTNAILQANLAVAMGDLAFRFPNAIEPYTPRIYAMLKDPSRRVRRHTLMVLTHLILNDMVKVKGQVCEIALCLEDSDPRIRDMSRLLFHELSKRSNNPIYNLLPEIISRLSQMEAQKQAFRSIMAFLLSFIKKEKQNEVLVEKICQRFPTCGTISQKAALAFCLANLKANDKCIKILNDSFKFYKDALFDEEVFKCFSLIVQKAKTFMKPEMKEVIDEWEIKLKSENADGMENHVAGVKANHAKEKAAARHAKNGKCIQRGAENIPVVNTTSSENSEHSFHHPEQENKNPAKRIASKNISVKKTPRKKENVTGKNIR
jgi:condensin complex subunit 1